MEFINTAKESATKPTERSNKIGWYEDHDYCIYLIK